MFESKRKRIGMLQSLCSIFRYDFNGRGKVLFQASDSSTGKNGTIGKFEFQGSEKLFAASSGEFDCQLMHPSLAAVALIHDVEWHETDKTKEKFAESNDRFKQNGYKVAKSEFAWYNPRRYVVMNQARRFGNYCQLFGWDAWNSDCTCSVCRKKRKKEVKEVHAKNA